MVKCSMFSCFWCFVPVHFWNINFNFLLINTCERADFVFLQLFYFFFILFLPLTFLWFDSSFIFLSSVLYSSFPFSLSIPFLTQSLPFFPFLNSFLPKSSLPALFSSFSITFFVSFFLPFHLFLPSFFLLSVHFLLHFLLLHFLSILSFLNFFLSLFPFFLSFLFSIISF